MSLTSRLADAGTYKRRFITDVLAEESAYIKSEQMRVANEWGLFETGELKRTLQGHFSVGAEGAGGRSSLSYVKYIRFLDMKNVAGRKKGYEIYNKIVYGITYNRIVRRIAFGFTQEIIDRMKQLDNQTIEING